MASLKGMRLESGELQAFAWPGGYPIYYLAEDNSIFCPDCANGKNGSDAYTDDQCQCKAHRDPQWHIVACDVHYEGPPLTCDHCHADIESAYGDPDAEENDG